MLLASTTTVILQAIGIGVGTVVGVGGLAATIWAIGRVRGVETSIDLLNAANDGLRDANQDLRVKLEMNERECSERITRLEGQNSALLNGLGDKLATVISNRLEHVLEAATTRIVDGISQRSQDRERRFTTTETETESQTEHRTTTQSRSQPEERQ